MVALNQATLQVQAGEIHAIVGENGAGNSTLMKVLSGVYPHGSYSGHARSCSTGRSASLQASATASTWHHHHSPELALVPLPSIAENIFLGNETARHGVIDWMAAHSRAQGCRTRWACASRPTHRWASCVGKQQLVEIAKALSRKVRLLIPTSPPRASTRTTAVPCWTCCWS